MRNLILLLFLFSSTILSAQKKIAPAKKTNFDRSAVKIKTDHRSQIPRAKSSIFDVQAVDYSQALHLHRSVKEKQLKFTKDKNSGLPIMISGALESPNRNASSVDKSFEYLNAVKAVIQIKNPEQEFVLKKETTTASGIKHIRMNQYFNGVKIHGGEVVLHEKDGDIFLFNGRYYPTPQLENLNPGISLSEVKNIVKSDLPNWQDLDENQQLFIAHEQLKTELVIYHEDKNTTQEKLVWHIIAIPNLLEKLEYFVDAQTGDILHQFNNICQFHGDKCTSEDHDHKAINTKHTHTADEAMAFGPETALATDLQGINRTINVYETGGTYYMIDASRQMFNPSLSNLPNNPSGVIWSINAFNTSPENSNFSYDHVTSGNNSWNNPTAVSAQYSAGLAYDYFKNTFGRESINGQGGNIVSFINVADADGSDMDNAFWNGAAMFYGNGDDAFNAPLAKALDVAGHEMSHGVIQNEANLEYQFESGALNESFADIFGAMIDRDDWKIGEEVANPSVFPTGTMRDMENPNNGGNSGNFYWQPMHVNEMYTGNQDNGGVHINSGIPNHAYYLFATAIGKDKAEEIYYDVLANYLVASSQFIDLRFAVVQATSLEYGANSTEVTAANNAFNAVGIGEGGGDDYQDDINVNPGDDFVLWSDPGLSTINNATNVGTFDGLFSNTDHISRPSLTDDGSIILFIDSDNNMIEIDVDWSTGEIINEYVINGSGNWRNVATSKDGSKLAAITTDNDNMIFVYDFNTTSSQWFELYNPTTAQGVSTGDVQFPDVLEWDFSGQFILYDAQNSITGASSNIEYWDVGFVKVWDNASDNFSDGLVSKLFSGLPENVSIGNPTFSKNSPYIIAFDFIESTSQGVNYEVLGVNTQTGDQGLIFENNRLGYPSYSVNDDQIIFSFLNSGTDPIIALRGLESDKINGTGNAFLFIEEASEWATWFATGERNLNTATDDLFKNLGISVYPNPVSDILTIEWKDSPSSDTHFEIIDLTGKIWNSGLFNGQKSTIDMSDMATGIYFLRFFDGAKMGVKKIMKN